MTPLEELALWDEVLHAQARATRLSFADVYAQEQIKLAEDYAREQDSPDDPVMDYDKRRE